MKLKLFTDTWEKARKIVDDPMYKTTDDETLGKGHRSKFDNTKYLVDSSSPEEINSQQSQTVNKSTRTKDTSKFTTKTKKKDESLKGMYLLFILV